ncbi:MAG: hypothetical protein FWG81_05005 [Betaproteobacteria bacterium]|nr:hypothetical protein [Betaproteobacteria bacterium]
MNSGWSVFGSSSWIRRRTEGRPRQQVHRRRGRGRGGNPYVEPPRRADHFF